MSAPAALPEPTSQELDITKEYQNPRLDPKNYLEGPLSPNPATRLRQLLARPGIIVGPFDRYRCPSTHPI